MTYIAEGLRRQVVQRAEGYCEYCRIHQDDRYFAHEVDHIYAEKHSGLTQEANLCLACGECNRYKGSDLCSLDIVTNTIVALSHPRKDEWKEHFRLEDGLIKGLTPSGRVTERLLHFNDGETVDRRRILIEAGRYFIP
jgi:hypothetical protein